MTLYFIGWIMVTNAFFKVAILFWTEHFIPGPWKTPGKFKFQLIATQNSWNFENSATLRAVVVEVGSSSTSATVARNVASCDTYPHPSPPHKLPLPPTPNEVKIAVTFTLAFVYSFYGCLFVCHTEEPSSYLDRLRVLRMRSGLGGNNSNIDNVSLTSVLFS